MALSGCQFFSTDFQLPATPCTLFLLHAEPYDFWQLWRLIVTFDILACQSSPSVIYLTWHGKEDGSSLIVLCLYGSLSQVYWWKGVFILRSPHWPMELAILHSTPPEVAEMCSLRVSEALLASQLDRVHTHFPQSTCTFHPTSPSPKIMQRFVLKSLRSNFRYWTENELSKHGGV